MLSISKKITLVITLRTDATDECVWLGVIVAIKEESRDKY